MMKNIFSNQKFILLYTSEYRFICSRFHTNGSRNTSGMFRGGGWITSSVYPQSSLNAML